MMGEIRKTGLAIVVLFVALLLAGFFTMAAEKDGVLSDYSPDWTDKYVMDFVKEDVNIRYIICDNAL
jgi:hypothetical protein